MRTTPPSTGHALALLALLSLALTGCVGGATGWRPPESAKAWDVPIAQVVARMEEHGLACTGLRLATPPPRNTRHAGTCRLRGEWVEVRSWPLPPQRLEDGGVGRLPRRIDVVFRLACSRMTKR